MTSDGPIAGISGASQSTPVLTRPEAEPAPGVGAEAESAAPSPPTGRPSRLLVIGLIALFAVPLIVALVALAHPTWFPSLDYAYTDLRVRDVFTLHPPLIGLPGRIGTAAWQGSHPGPLSFYALAPFSRLFGSSTWALQAATASLNLIAIAAILWMARRRGGTALLLGVAATLAVLAAFYGPRMLAQPWNPYLPVLWWIVFLVGVWSVVCDDFVALPFVVFAGTFCAQTHISYVGIVGGTTAALALWMIWALRKAETRRHAWRWLVAAGALGVVLWLPPVVQQLRHEHGNLQIIYDYFTNPPEQAIGFGEGLKIILIQANPWHLIAHHPPTTVARIPWTETTSPIPGAVFGVVWIAGVVVAWRLRAKTLLRLDAVVAVSLALGLVSTSRIFGLVLPYLALWSWGLTALMGLTIGWTVALVVARMLPPEREPQVARVGRIVLVVAIAAALVGFTSASSRTEPTDVRQSALVRGVAPATIAALQHDIGHRHSRYIVTWSDPVWLGSTGFGLFDALERAGVTVGLPEHFAAVTTPDRIFRQTPRTGVVHLAVGKTNIAKARAIPGLHEVAHVDLRTPAQRAEYLRLRDRVAARLHAAGRDDVASLVDRNAFLALLSPNLSATVENEIRRMIDLGAAARVFVLAPAR